MKVFNQIYDDRREFVGTDNIKIVSLEKNGSTSLLSLATNYDWIKVFHPNPQQLEDYMKNKDILILFPLREQYDRIFSAYIEILSLRIKKSLIEDIKIYKLGAGPKSWSITLEKLWEDEDCIKRKIIELFNFHPSTKSPLRIPNQPTDWHSAWEIKHKYFTQWILVKFIQNIFLNDDWNGCEFKFFDLKDLSSKEFINYLSEKDERWKDVVIPYKNSVGKTKPQKRTIVKILEEIENPYRGLDWYKYAKSWNHLTNLFFTPIKKSKHYIRIGGSK